jgi:hypothetical protein
LAKLSKVGKFSFKLAGKPTGFELDASSNESLERCCYINCLVSSSTPGRMARCSLLTELRWVTFTV